MRSFLPKRPLPGASTASAFRSPSASYLSSIPLLYHPPHHQMRFYTGLGGNELQKIHGSQEQQPKEARKAIPPSRGFSITQGFEEHEVIKERAERPFLTDGKITLKEGSVVVTKNNISNEIRDGDHDLPIMVLIYSQDFEPVVEFTQMVVDEVHKVNKDYALKLLGREGILEIPEGMQILCVKLGLLDFQQYRSLALEFEPDTTKMPQICFMWQGNIIDRLVGMVSKEHIEKSLQNLMGFMDEQVDALKAERDLGSTAPSSEEMFRTVEEDLKKVKVTAVGGFGSPDVPAARKQYEALLEKARPKVAALRRELDISLEDLVTEAELRSKMRIQPYFDLEARAEAGLIALMLADNQLGGAKEAVHQFRRNFPWATGEIPEVGRIIVHVELIDLLDIPAEKLRPSSLSMPWLLKPPQETKTNPIAFYGHKMQMAALKYIHDQTSSGMEDMMKVIRAEKALAEPLKAAGLMSDSGSSTASTPARDAMLLMIEGVGTSSNLGKLNLHRLQKFLC